MSVRFVSPIVSALLASVAVSAMAQGTGAAPRPAPSASAVRPVAGVGSPTWIDGVVRQVDRKKHRLTLQHGPITNLDMPGMTMAFPVADRTLLETVKPGDAVRFTAEQVDGNVTVTQVKRAQ